MSTGTEQPPVPVERRANGGGGMISLRKLLIYDALTLFIITFGSAIIPTLFEIFSKTTAGLIVGFVGALIACSNQLRNRLQIPPPTQAMVAQAVRDIAPGIAKKAAEDAAPAAAAAAAPGAAADVAAQATRP